MQTNVTQSLPYRIPSAPFCFVYKTMHSLWNCGRTFIEHHRLFFCRVTPHYFVPNLLYVRLSILYYFFPVPLSNTFYLFYTWSSRTFAPIPIRLQWVNFLTVVCSIPFSKDVQRVVPHLHDIFFFWLFILFRNSPATVFVISYFRIFGA